MSETVVQPRRIGRKWDLTGCRFGTLRVLRKHPATDSDGRPFWCCQCVCGKIISVRQSNLIQGQTSCGCQRGQRIRRHGMSGTRIHSIWINMRRRCRNPRSANYSRYGGRGITVCKRWRNSFEAFFADMGPSYREGLSIDRIDNALGYCQENCRWADGQTQSNNRRTSAPLFFQGATHTAAEWSRITGISPYTIRSRLGRGWSVERALTEPARAAPPGGAPGP
jgi:hypothetical protein